MNQTVEVDANSLRRLVTALKKEADGKALVKDLTSRLKEIATPARDAARAAIMTMEVHGVRRQEPGLRESIAARTSVSVRTTGRRARVAVVVSKRGMPRQFGSAGQKINRGEWRHPVFHTGKWVTQRGKAGWFDETLDRFKPEAKDAAKRALDEVAERISISTKR